MEVETDLPVILVVEDDPDDRLLLQIELAGSRIEKAVHFMENEIELLDYLDSQRGASGGRPLTPNPEDRQTPAAAGALRSTGTRPVDLILLEAFPRGHSIAELVHVIRSSQAVAQATTIAIMLDSEIERELSLFAGQPAFREVVKPIRVEQLERLLGQGKVTI